MTRGTLRIYLGAAPGVGKTFAMLNEGRRASQRGRDVVVAFVETHGRAGTGAQMRELEVVPRQLVTYRGQEFEELDLNAVLARAPSLALVDELAHSNIPGLRHTKRWEDVETLQRAGINVISTVIIQHLESLNDVVTDITGIRQGETLPDAVVRSADQVELIDMSPESLRRRLAHGNIYSVDRADAAMVNFFRIGNLGALRELTLLWLADRVDEGLRDYRARHGIAEPWETKERVVVALTGVPGGERLVRRGARMAARAHADLLGVTIRPSDGLARPQSPDLDRQRKLLAELGGRFAEISGNDVGRDLASFAREENATQLLLGAISQSRWAQIVRGSVINDVVRHAAGIDVHIIGAPRSKPRTATVPLRAYRRPTSHTDADIDAEAEADAEADADAAGIGRLPHLTRRRHLAMLSQRRRISGWVLALAILPGLTLTLITVRHSLGPVGTLPLVLLGVVVVATVGGLAPAVVGALVGYGFADWFLVPPFASLNVSNSGDAAAFAVFVTVGVLVALSVDRLARRSVQVARSRAEVEALARLVGRDFAGGSEALDVLVAELRTTFGVAAVAILEEVAGHGPPAWELRAGAGTELPASPDEAEFCAEIGLGAVLVITGRHLDGDDRRLLSVFVDHLRMVQVGNDVARTAASAESLAETNELRTALLAAVSHDLRTPLASIKACATSLLSEDLDWDPATVHSFVTTIDEGTDRLNRLVGNLLDMSRRQTGALAPHLEAVGLDEVVAAALASLSVSVADVALDVPETLAGVHADPALLERVVANLLSSALAWSPPGAVVRVAAGAGPPDDPQVRAGAERSRQTSADKRRPSRVELRVIDIGPGIPPDQRDAVFLPFQRLGDATFAAPTGVGLGLAVARGFVEAMRGELSLEDTPGGGLTAVISLPAAP